MLCHPRIFADPDLAFFCPLRILTMDSGLNKNIVCQKEVNYQNHHFCRLYKNLYPEFRRQMCTSGTLPSSIQPTTIQPTTYYPIFYYISNLLLSNLLLSNLLLYIQPSSLLILILSIENLCSPITKIL